MEIRAIKERFGIIGDDPRLNAAIDTAQQIATTDLSVLITGESGVGKEVIPQIIHYLSPRKHNNYVAINCGAIPEGTIDSELFGHEKGSFTGANEARKGYFEVADGGTIFLDEVGELPLSTQVRLLRVLETGEFLRVGSSKPQKTNVRVIGASNINFIHAMNVGKFREDLYYRLNAVPISIPPLRERKNDIHLLFKKFALDFADKYMMPAIRLDDSARALLEAYRWPGNIRQLKNVAEQISVLERERTITAETLVKYLPSQSKKSVPVKMEDSGAGSGDGMTDRDIIFKILFQLRQEVDELKSIVSGSAPVSQSHPSILPPPDNSAYTQYHNNVSNVSQAQTQSQVSKTFNEDITDVEQVETPTMNLSLNQVTEELIKKALEKHGGKRKAAAAELGISERTLYRKLKDLNLDH